MSVFYFISAYLNALAVCLLYILYWEIKLNFLHLEQKYPLRYHQNLLHTAKTVTSTRETSL